VALPEEPDLVSLFGYGAVAEVFEPEELASDG
jgi:hypothetical protein